MRKLTVGAIAVGALLAMGLLRGVDLWRSRDATLQVAETRAANLALIFSEYLGETFASADAALRQLVLHSARVGGPAAPARDWAPSLASARAGIASVGAISVLDRDLVIRHSTRPEIIGESRAGEAAFRRALQSPGGELVVGTPFRPAIDPRDVLIPIGRRLMLPDGTLEGSVVASYFPTAPRGFFRSVDIGQRGTVWVFHPDGVVLFREPSADDPMGEPAGGNALFAAASRNGGRGIHRGPVTAGGPSLLSAFHTASAAPLIVAVSLDREEVLAGWTRELAGSAAMFAILSVALAMTLVVLFRQIDAKAAAEQALERARQLEAEHLREANEQLASALAREQGARRDAEAASALKDQFLMTVSHELRTPLTAIHGWARMLLEGAVSDDRKDAALQSIDRNAQAQTRLIDDLLDVAKAMTGKVRLDPQAVPVAEVVRHAVESIGAAAHAKGILVETAIDPAAGTVAGDAERLQQVVWNLLTNAVKFTPEGGRVRVSAAPVGRDVEITVTDTGVGISPEFLPHVFDRFRQEDVGTTRRYGGLGLGLTIVRNLVELHGGSVAAHSDGPGRGAAFTVRIPSCSHEDHEAFSHEGHDDHEASGHEDRKGDEALGDAALGLPRSRGALGPTPGT